MTRRFVTRSRISGCLVVVLTAALVGAAAPASAISSYNSRPAPERTNVGELLGLGDRGGDGSYDHLYEACSGTMIASDVYLTAAHCLALARPHTRFFVSLDEDVRGELAQATALGLSGLPAAEWLVANGHVVEGDAFWDPQAGQDVGVIDFSRRSTTPADLWTFTPATLPTANELSTLGSRVLAHDSWVTVGYGSQEADNSGGGRPTYPGGGVRLEAPMGFDSIRRTLVTLAANESRGFGSACYGDSGGPNLVTVNGQPVLASITITGDIPCYATNVTYRMDTAPARAFLAQFVALPL
jgi:Trypsin